MPSPYDQEKDDLEAARVDVLRRMAEAEASRLVKEQAEAAERNRMLDEGGHNDDE